MKNKYKSISEKGLTELKLLYLKIGTRYKRMCNYTRKI